MLLCPIIVPSYLMKLKNFYLEYFGLALEYTIIYSPTFNLGEVFSLFVRFFLPSDKDSGPYVSFATLIFLFVIQYIMLTFYYQHFCMPTVL